MPKFLITCMVQQELSYSKSRKNLNVIFDIDWQGADQIKNKKLDYKLITFFIYHLAKKYY